jgi:hypothetical protein
VIWIDMDSHNFPFVTPEISCTDGSLYALLQLHQTECVQYGDINGRKHMLELIVLFAFLLLAFVALKVLVLIFKIGFWALTLPLQILLGLVVAILAVVLIVPLALVAGLFGLVLAPFALLLPLLPFLLIAGGLYLLLRS